ncbi:TPA: hypothetical protein L3996_002575 [Pseudomonas aeruginosa]|nr:hypothetical protein [Pseudomonas aeruginosa]MBG5021125.1 hypothetical protein [Pseudomonas aeruginosa]MBG6783849.1 hypothetical protein [Pseudomonas aeruginosa]MBH9215778.1 hypothetical protein [Pseudomonas aeruginosa]MBI8137270.1 hypothetical protein [Pseudomonas aeruginosa]MBI8444087.1 hypothetical protein [Pseudomonas aeruginosa]
MTNALRRHDLDMRPKAIPLSLMTVVENALSMAWRRLLDDVEKGAFSICQSTEDVITERLYMILGELDSAGDDAVPGLSLLQTPAREGNIRNFNGDHLDKQPDLTFRPIRNLIPSSNTVPTAIFIECKPVDSVHPLISTYCRSGLMRFINGDYAWGVDRAMMVGYVRNICALPGGLFTAFSDPLLSSELGLNGQLEPLPNTAAGDAVHQSLHWRCFLVPEASAPAGKISINHLWLYPSKACEQSRCRDISAS